MITIEHAESIRSYRRALKAFNREYELFRRYNRFLIIKTMEYRIVYTLLDEV